MTYLQAQWFEAHRALATPLRPLHDTLQMKAVPAPAAQPVNSVRRFIHQLCPGQVNRSRASSVNRVLAIDSSCAYFLQLDNILWQLPCESRPQSLSAYPQPVCSPGSSWLKESRHTLQTSSSASITGTALLLSSISALAITAGSLCSDSVPDLF